MADMHLGSLSRLVLEKNGDNYYSFQCVTFCHIDYRSNYRSCSAQNRLADVEKPRMTNCVGVGKSGVQLF